MKKVSWLVLVAMFALMTQALAVSPTLEEVQKDIIEKTAQIAILTDQVKQREETNAEALRTIQQLTGQVFYMRGLVTKLKEPEKSLLQKAGIIPDKKADGKPNK